MPFKHLILRQHAGRKRSLFCNGGVEGSSGATRLGSVGRVAVLHVQLEAVLDDEAPGAERAAVRPRARVHVQVRPQVSRLRELLPALLAGERPLPGVDAGVDLQVLRRGVGLAADGADEALPLGVGVRVAVQPKGRHAAAAAVFVLEGGATGVPRGGAGDGDQLQPKRVALFHVLAGTEVSETHGPLGPSRVQVKVGPGRRRRLHQSAAAVKHLPARARRSQRALLDQLDVVLRERRRGAWGVHAVDRDVLLGRLQRRRLAILVRPTAAPPPPGGPSRGDAVSCRSSVT